MKNARSVVTGKMTTCDLIQDIARCSAFKEHDYITTKEMQQLCSVE
ncbi:MAG: hypothetical protein IKW32_02305 [Bacteroidaceae bacterium]|nr:hypothetical protein [Bacteroidaceae bacterium]